MIAAKLSPEQREQIDRLCESMDREMIGARRITGPGRTRAAAFSCNWPDRSRCLKIPPLVSKSPRPLVLAQFAPKWLELARGVAQTRLALPGTGGSAVLSIG